jgi:pentatricopeptide repeat domain-containing protein 1
MHTCALTPVVTYSGAITACGKADQWQTSLDLLIEMQQVHKLKPDLITYNSVLGALEKGGQGVWASQLLAEMRTAGN